VRFQDWNFFFFFRNFSPEIFTLLEALLLFVFVCVCVVVIYSFLPLYFLLFSSFVHSGLGHVPIVHLRSAGIADRLVEISHPIAPNSRARQMITSSSAIDRSIDRRENREPIVNLCTRHCAMIYAYALSDSNPSLHSLKSRCTSSTSYPDRFYACHPSMSLWRNYIVCHPCRNHNNCSMEETLCIHAMLIWNTHSGKILCEMFNVKRTNIISKVVGVMDKWDIMIKETNHMGLQ
jgi:hypothetical protein